jgi:RNA recognition motif-containing protein
MNLFVGNLNPETTVSSLRTLFSEFGEIVSAKIIFDNATGMSRGFGFVEMADKFHAFDAIDNIDCTFFEGNVISVKEAKQNNTKPGGHGGGKSFKPRGPRPGGFNSSRPASTYNSLPRPGGNGAPRPGGYNSDRFNSTSKEQ